MSNLPPGITESMLPGNRPEDAAFDKMLDSPFGDYLQDHVRELSQLDVSELIDALEEVTSKHVWCAFCGGLADWPEWGDEEKQAYYCSKGCYDSDHQPEEEEVQPPRKQGAYDKIQEPWKAASWLNEDSINQEGKKQND